jgi:formate dehydrogenase subunit gamma
MSEKGTRGWRRTDTEHVVQDVARELAEALDKEIREDMTEDQVKALAGSLSDSLARDAAAGARRVHRAFQDRDRRRRKAAERLRRREREEGSVERLSLHLRIQHMILFASTITLIVTGLPIKFHDAAVSAFLIHLMGGPQVTRIIHRIGAIGLTFIGAYHIFYTMAFESGRRDFGLLIPKLQDAKDFFHQIGYFLGLRKDRPLFGRFSYIEKFDSWAVYWGMVVMITSGYILWFKVLAINQFGKSIYDIAMEAHSDEALLATLAIVVWHFYNVHFNPKRFPGSLTWWNGRMGVEEFREEHPLEYEEMLRTGAVDGSREPSSAELSPARTVQGETP